MIFLYLPGCRLTGFKSAFLFGDEVFLPVFHNLHADMVLQISLLCPVCPAKAVNPFSIQFFVLFDLRDKGYSFPIQPWENIPRCILRVKKNSPGFDMQFIDGIREQFFGESQFCDFPLVDICIIHLPCRGDRNSFISPCEYNQMISEDMPSEPVWKNPYGWFQLLCIRFGADSIPVKYGTIVLGRFMLFQDKVNLPLVYTFFYHLRNSCYNLK